MAEKELSPQRKYDLEKGLISKSYKLNQDIVNDFAVACDAANVTQSGQLTSIMKKFIYEKNI